MSTKDMSRKCGGKRVSMDVGSQQKARQSSKTTPFCR